MTSNMRELPSSFTTIRSKPKPLAVKTRPRFSQSPWFGFTKHDWPRSEALDQCPSARCRRAKACRCAYDGLYCRRTHHSPEEIKILQKQTELGRAVLAVPRLGKNPDAEERELYMGDIANIKKNYQTIMTARWKVGEFDQLFGKYKPSGVLLKPPSKIYCDKP